MRQIERIEWEKEKDEFHIDLRNIILFSHIDTNLKLWIASTFSFIMTIVIVAFYRKIKRLNYYFIYIHKKILNIFSDTTMTMVIVISNDLAQIYITKSEKTSKDPKIK